MPITFFPRTKSIFAGSYNGKDLDGTAWLCLVVFWFCLIIWVFCALGHTLPRVEKLNARKGPFLCELTGNATMKLKYKNCNDDSTNCRRSYLFEAPMQVIPNASAIYPDRNYKEEIPEDFPLIGILRHECRGKRRCRKKLGKFYQARMSRDCFYRTHGKPVFWTNRDLTFRQESDIITYSSLLGVLCVMALFYLVRATDSYSVLLAFVPEFFCGDHGHRRQRRGQSRVHDASSAGLQS